MLVESSAIRAVVYDTRRGRLRVTFVSGQRYEYRGVSREIHRAFLDAPSKGRFFQVAIRDRYRCERLG